MFTYVYMSLRKFTYVVLSNPLKLIYSLYPQWQPYQLCINYVNYVNFVKKSKIVFKLQGVPWELKKSMSLLHGQSRHSGI